MSFLLSQAAATPAAPFPRLLLLLVLLAAAADLVAGTCYRIDGLPYSKIRTDDGDWIPCDNSATVSSCCSAKDYCLGNGLCLDAGANNYFSIQGCTDPSWPAPCVKTPQCEKNIQDEYSFAFPCRQATNASFYYCCGQTAQCCNSTAEEDLLTFPGVTEIARPTLLPAGGDPSGTKTVTVTVTSTPTGAIGTVLADSSQSGGADSKTLGIGLGVGLPVAAALIVALVFFGCQMRRKYKWDPHGDAVPIPTTLAGAAEPKSPAQSAMTAVNTPGMQQQQQPQDYQQQQAGGQGGGGGQHLSYNGSSLAGGSQGSPYQPHFPPSNSSTPVPANAFNYSSQAPAPAVTVYQQMQQHGQGGGGYPFMPGEVGGQQQQQHHEVHELGPQQ
ncbi:hypothetical protein B0H66DRAFT_596815 [Apodospora peruviana]|uniref:Uncharacterized protein n=1 Tax=Apodospora peruviana TaxID=516989 RepID=A0AAE0IPY6_9PEZI|nr:hypothetical protein B0H66DRAFT_596815 [Apodospora peruviana]